MRPRRPAAEAARAGRGGGRGRPGGRSGVPLLPPVDNTYDALKARLVRGDPATNATAATRESMDHSLRGLPPRSSCLWWGIDEVISWITSAPSFLTQSYATLPELQQLVGVSVVLLDREKDWHLIGVTVTHDARELARCARELSSIDPFLCSLRTARLPTSSGQVFPRRAPSAAFYRALFDIMLGVATAVNSPSFSRACMRALTSRKVTTVVQTADPSSTSSPSGPRGDAGGGSESKGRSNGPGGASARRGGGEGGGAACAAGEGDAVRRRGGGEGGRLKGGGGARDGRGEENNLSVGGGGPLWRSTSQGTEGGSRGGGSRDGEGSFMVGRGDDKGRGGDRGRGEGVRGSGVSPGSSGGGDEVDRLRRQVSILAAQMAQLQKNSAPRGLGDGDELGGTVRRAQSMTFTPTRDRGGRDGGDAADAKEGVHLSQNERTASFTTASTPPTSPFKRGSSKHGGMKGTAQAQSPTKGRSPTRPGAAGAGGFSAFVALGASEGGRGGGRFDGEAAAKLAARNAEMTVKVAVAREQVEAMVEDGTLSADAGAALLATLGATLPPPPAEDADAGADGDADGDVDGRDSAERGVEEASGVRHSADMDERLQGSGEGGRRVRDGAEGSSRGRGGRAPHVRYGDDEGAGDVHHTPSKTKGAGVDGVVQKEGGGELSRGGSVSGGDGASPRRRWPSRPKERGANLGGEEEKTSASGRGASLSPARGREASRSRSPARPAAPSGWRAIPGLSAEDVRSFRDQERQKVRGTPPLPPPQEEPSGPLSGSRPATFSRRSQVVMKHMQSLAQLIATTEGDAYYGTPQTLAAAAVHASRHGSPARSHSPHSRGASPPPGGHSIAEFGVTGPVSALMLPPGDRRDLSPPPQGAHQWPGHKTLYHTDDFDAETARVEEAIGHTSAAEAAQARYEREAARRGAGGAPPSPRVIGSKSGSGGPHLTRYQDTRAASPGPQRRAFLTLRERQAQQQEALEVALQEQQQELLQHQSALGQRHKDDLEKLLAQLQRERESRLQQQHVAVKVQFDRKEELLARQRELEAAQAERFERLKASFAEQEAALQARQAAAVEALNAKQKEEGLSQDEYDVALLEIESTTRAEQKNMTAELEVMSDHMKDAARAEADEMAAMAVEFHEAWVHAQEKYEAEVAAAEAENEAKAEQLRQQQAEEAKEAAALLAAEVQRQKEEAATLARQQEDERLRKERAAEEAAALEAERRQKAEREAAEALRASEAEAASAASIAKVAAQKKKAAEAAASARRRLEDDEDMFRADTQAIFTQEREKMFRRHVDGVTAILSEAAEKAAQDATARSHASPSAVAPAPRPGTPSSSKLSPVGASVTSQPAASTTGPSRRAFPSGRGFPSGKGGTRGHAPTAAAALREAMSSSPTRMETDLPPEDADLDDIAAELKAMGL